MELEGATAIVTGSSSGVGAATAELLASKGCNVVINYASSAEAAQTVAERCNQIGVETEVVQADVADDDACRRLAAAAEQRWGRVDILVNNAGVTKFCDHADLDGLSADDFQRIYAVNTVGAYQMTRAVVPLMRAGGAGNVVNVASIAGVMGVGSCIAYAASKGALITMSLSLARSLGPEIRVNTVCPGFIQGSWLREGMGADRYDAAMAHLEATTPLKLTSTAQSVAEGIVMFVTGPDTITGETLLLDGGHHLMQLASGRR